MYGWAVGERRLPASPEQLEEEERDNAYTTRRGSLYIYTCFYFYLYFYIYFQIPVI